MSIKIRMNHMKFCKELQFMTHEIEILSNTKLIKTNQIFSNAMIDTNFIKYLIFQKALYYYHH